MGRANLTKASFVCLALVLILSQGLLGSRAAAEKKAPIILGGVYGTSGVMSPYGLSSVAAAEIAVDEINAAGGVLGRPFKLIQRDSESSPEKGVRVMRDLILRYKVDFVMGPISSAVGLAISAIAKERKVLLVSTNARTTKLTVEEGHRYLVSIGSRTEMTARSAAYFVAKNPQWQRIWTIGSDFEYGRSVMAEFVSGIKTAAPGVKIIGQSWPPLGEMDMGPYITEILAAKPDFVYGCILGGALAAMIKQGKPYGFFEKVKYLDASALDVGILEPLGMETPEGLFGNSIWHWNMLDTPKNKAFVKEMRKRLGRYPEHAGAGAYAGVYLLAEAIKKAGKVDTEAVIDAMEGMTVDTLVGPVTIRPIDHQANWPEFICISKKVPDLPFLVMEHHDQIPVEKIMLTPDEVKARRKK